MSVYQPSMIEVIIDNVKTLIDNGDVDGATAEISNLTNWIPDPIGDMKIHIERWREQNARCLAGPSSVFEDAALAVLDWLESDDG